MKVKRPKKSSGKIQYSGGKSTGYPVFCLKHLQWQTLKKADGALFKAFIERAHKLEDLGWEKINVSDRHSYGMEQIPVKALKPKLPSFVSPDVKTLLAFRYTGDNLPFLALRNGDILHVIYIETRFGDIYDHGSK